MSLLLAASRRTLAAPSAITTDSGSYSVAVADTMASLGTLFALTVTGLGQADGTWAVIASSGPIASKIGLSATTGASVNLVTTGSIVGLTGASGCSVTWTGQGGSPVLTQGFIITVNTVTPLTFNPSRLGWLNLVTFNDVRRLNPLRVNAAGQMRPWDGGSQMYVNGPWSQNMNADKLWNDPRNWSQTINNVLDSNSRSGLVFLIAFYMFNPQGSSTGLPTYPTPTTMAKFKSDNPINYNISSVWPLGTAAGDNLEASRVKCADTWDKYGQGWFDDVILGPWIGTTGLFARFKGLNLPYLRIILRPCWEGNDDWVPRSGKLWIEGQSYIWVNSAEYAKIVRTAFKRIIDTLNNHAPSGFPAIELALGPLAATHAKTGEQYIKQIHVPGSGESTIFSFVGNDPYDSFIGVGPGYDGTTNTARFNKLASEDTSFNYWKSFMTTNPGLGYKLGFPEWGCHSDNGDPSNIECHGPPTPDGAKGGCDNSTYIDSMWNLFTSEKNNGRMGLEVYYWSSWPRHELGVINPSAASPTYVGASNKKDASRAFHTHYGLGYNPNA